MKITAYSIAPFLASALLLLAGCGGDGAKDSAQGEPAPARQETAPGETTDTAANEPSPAAYTAEVDAWHAQRVQRLQAEDGWLSLVGLHHLEEGENRIGSSADNTIQLPGDHPRYIGSIHFEGGAEGGQFRFESAPDVEVIVDGEATREIVLTTDGEGTAPPTRLQTGTLSFYIIQRGENHYLRSKDSASEVRENFAGIERYPVDEAWRVEARLVPFAEPVMVEIPNIMGTSEPHAMTAHLEFELQGQTYSLLPIGEPGEGLFIVFGDAGNGVTSYGGGRFLYTDVPAEDGTVILDFNRAYNPPCAFTPYATCPLPPLGNTLPIEVSAGEKSWGDGHH